MLGTALAASLLLSLSDPIGDANGDGTYQLPSSLSDEQKASLDLRSFEAYNNNGSLQLEIGLSALANPLNSPMGFSVPEIDVYIKTALGGAHILGSSGFRTPNTSGWQYHIKINPFRARIFEQKEGQSKATERAIEDFKLKIETKGSKVIINSTISNTAYSYWVTTSLYDPLTPDGIQMAGTMAGPYTLATSLPHSPSAIDVLYEKRQSGLYATRVLPPIGKNEDHRPWFLLAIGMVAALVSLVLTAAIWGYDD